MTVHEGGSARIAHPRFTIVTASFNQCRYLQRTLRSVAEQDRPDVEHVVIDGGSTDGSRELLAEHDATLAYWRSGRDGGQPDAWNRGLSRARGELVGFINSDDLLLPGALDELEALAAGAPAAEWLIGGTLYFGPGSRNLWYPGVVPRKATDVLYFTAYTPQPGHFFRRGAIERIGGFDATLQYGFDFDFLVRAALAGIAAAATTRPIAAFRFHDASKTVAARARQLADTRVVQERHHAAVARREGGAARRARARYFGHLALEEARTLLGHGEAAAARRAFLRALARYPVMLGTRAAAGTLQRILGLRRD